MSAVPLPPAASIESDVRRALDEDIGSGDATSALLPDVADTAYLLCKEDAVVCGRPWFDLCHRAIDPDVRIHWHVEEGARVAGTRARILDTRKTLPGLRLAQKYAVRVGGGTNHRIGLYDAVMLKENHIRAAGSIAGAVQASRERFASLPVIVEVETLDQLREALDSACDRILIDDFDAGMRRDAVRIAAGRIPLEVSGGVDLSTVRAIAEDGVDCISVGGLTKHVRAIDLSLKLGRRPG